jgi:hypothetical protein
MDSGGIVVPCPAEAEIILFSPRPGLLSGPPCFLSHGNRDLFLQELSGLVVKLTIHFHLVPRLGNPDVDG